MCNLFIGKDGTINEDKKWFRTDTGDIIEEYLSDSDKKKSLYCDVF
jgi:hypothetical protein